jgi:hypothetical protein
MSAQEGNVGTTIKLRALKQNGDVKDISSYTTTKDIVFKNPLKAAVVKAGTFSNGTGSDGYLEYTSESGFFLPGKWYAQMKISDGTDTFKSSIAEFDIVKDLPES